MLSYEYQVMHQLELKHWWFRARRRLLLRLLRDTTNRRRAVPPPHILDYGCGTGGNTRFYASVGSVVGIEPESSAIRLAQARGEAQYCCGRGNELPFRAEAFDAVVASDVLEHIEDDRSAMSEITRVLRPGGTLVITVPAHPWLFSRHDAALHHFRRYTRSGLRSLVEQGGLKIRVLSYWNATLFPAISLYRLLVRRRVQSEPRSDTVATPWVLNELLAAVLTAEGRLLPHLPLPWGLSLVAAADRPATAEDKPLEEVVNARDGQARRQALEQDGE
jgi:SAM-dependent methyltransferase